MRFQVDDAVDYRRQVMRIFFFCVLSSIFLEAICWPSTSTCSCEMLPVVQEVLGVGHCLFSRVILSCAAAASGLRQRNHLFVLSEQMVLIGRLQPQDGYLPSS